MIKFSTGTKFSLGSCREMPTTNKINEYLQKRTLSGLLYYQKSIHGFVYMTLLYLTFGNYLYIPIQNLIITRLWMVDPPTYRW